MHYGIGGHYTNHFDNVYFSFDNVYSRKKYNFQICEKFGDETQVKNVFGELGDRLATWIFYVFYFILIMKAFLD